MKALLLEPEGIAVDVSADLADAGLQLLARVSSRSLVQAAQEQGPDLVIAMLALADEATLRACAELDAANGPPLLMFVQQADPATMERALSSGVHELVIAGYAAHRLPTLLQMTLLRARLQRDQRAQASALAERFEERKLVDRAKGILMRARQISEEEAFGLLRTVSMSGRQRVGELSRQLITTAGHAESINQAGQLRMLSQRIVKLQTLRVRRIGLPANNTRLSDSRQRVASLLAALAALKGVTPRAPFAASLRAAKNAWRALEAELGGPPEATRLEAADSAAERLLLAAEALTESLELAGMSKSLHVVNLCGRQRMLSQRLAKLALLAAGSSAPAEHHAELAATERAFSEALATLQQLPLSTPEIRNLLGSAGAHWSGLRNAAFVPPSAAGWQQLAETSEAVLDSFELLTERYEHSMQVLMG